MGSDSALQLTRDRGWRSGLTNLLRRENGRWWHTHRWWQQSLLWFVALNGILVFTLWIAPHVGPSKVVSGAVRADWQAVAGASVAEAMIGPLALVGVLPVFGVLAITQAAIVEEKQTGTATWILSGPVSRPAFILSKFIANATGFMVTVVLLQGLVAYAQLSLAAGALMAPAPLLAAFGLNALHLLFYLALTLMLGALFSSRAPILAVSIGILLGQGILEGVLGPLVPWFAWHYLPAQLPQLAVIAMQGQPLPSPAPVVATLLLCGLFVLVAIGRFGREEF